MKALEIIKYSGRIIKHTAADEWQTFLLSTFGTLLYSLGVVIFTIPYHFPDSGVMGIAVILKYSIGFSPSIFTLLANAALFIWGGREVSKRFVIWSIYSVLLTSFLLGVLDGIPFPHVGDMFLVAVAGGLIKGVGGGMVFRTGASMGGTDIIVTVLRKRLGIEVGKYSFYLNMFILMISVPVVGFEKALYGVVAAYISGEATDNVLSSFDKRRLVFIVTNETPVIDSYIVNELHRSSTVLYGEGGYTGDKRDTVMCLLTPRQVMVLKRYLAKAHPTSFMAVTGASEVLGKGFKRWRSV